MDRYRLSLLDLMRFRSCPRCFWLQLNRGLPPPAASPPPFSSHAEAHVRRYFDRFRLEGAFAPELRPQLIGEPFRDLDRLAEWRDAERGLRLRDPAFAVELVGVLDDLVVDHDVYLPLAYKSSGGPPTPSSPRHYQLQLDCSALLLESNGFAGVGVAYLLFYYPRAFEQGQLQMNFTAVRASTNPVRAWQTVRQALSTLRGPLPARGAGCRYCNWLQQLELLEMQF